MRLSEHTDRQLVAGRDYPNIEGKVKITLHNCKNHKDEFVYESKNMVTNALKDIFATNPGGLVNYQNFASLYNTWLGGVLVFGNQLDLSSADDYGIPAYTDNPVRAHAGQTSLTDQADDITRGNPNSLGTVLTANSTKLVFEWGTSAGNGVISSLGLTHTDTGSYGVCGANGTQSVAQQTLQPIAEVGAFSRNYSYGDSADAVMAINGNTAYTFYLVNSTTVDIFITPINNNKFKLQGGADLPLTDYTTKITATLPSSYNISAKGECYYHWDFENNKLILFGVPTRYGTDLYRDDINLSDGTVTHSAITVTGASLWKFETSTQSGYGVGSVLTIPVKAMILNNHFYVYGIDYIDNYNHYAKKIFKINLANTTDITEIDTSEMGITFNTNSACSMPAKFAILGDLIVNEGFIINGNKAFRCDFSRFTYTLNRNYVNPYSISSLVAGLGTSINIVGVNKLYLATKYNLPAPVTKTNAQSMTVEYTLREV